MERIRWIKMVFTLATCVVAACASTAAAQNHPSIAGAFLAQGNPPLTESMVTRYSDFMGWLMEVSFSPAQRKQLRSILVNDWKDPETTRMVMIMLSLSDTIDNLPSDDNEFVRISLQEDLLKIALANKKDLYSQWLASAYDEAHHPIAPGDPPLTESMVSHYATFVAWLLEIPLTQQFKDGQRAMMIRDWKIPKEIENDMRMLQWLSEIARFKNGQGERDYLRCRVQPELVKRIRADRSNPDEQALLAAYDDAHRPIASGKFPLTRQDTDAWAELYSYVSTLKGSPLIADQKFKDTMASEIAKKFARLPDLQQKSLSQMPQTWAELQISWMKGNDAERQNILFKWPQIGPPGQPADSSTAAGLAALQRSTTFTRRLAATVPEQELPAAAKDADLVVQLYSRPGPNQNLALAAQWEDIARAMHAGKAVYQARQENVDRQLILQAQLKAQQAINGARAISNAYVFGDAAMANVITNINNSPYQTVVVPVVPK
jgi:hypothetical protein